MHILLLLTALSQFPIPNQHVGTPWPSFREPSTRPVAPPIDPPPTADPGNARLVIAFTSTWCGPCARIKPALDALEAEGVAVQRVDYDSQRPLALAHNVTTLPTTIVMERGVEVNRRVGVVPLDELRAMARHRNPEPVQRKPTETLVEIPPSTVRGEPARFRLFRWRAAPQRPR